jgi:hypothetical protein
MDWIGNARHRVVLPYNYWPEQRWNQAFQHLGLQLVAKEKALDLYPRPARWLFERRLHFIARLEPQLPHEGKGSLV